MKVGTNIVIYCRTMEKVYKNLSNPVSLASSKKLYEAVKDQGKAKKEVELYLENEPSRP